MVQAALHMELNCKSGMMTSNPKNSNYYVEWKTVNESKIVDAFYGSTKSVVTCPYCREERHKYEPINVLPLPIPNVQNPNIHNCLSQLKHPEELHFYTCHNCESVNQHEVFKVLELSTSPDIFIFQFKRFNAFNNLKNQTLIHFPITGLNISEHILDEYKNLDTTVYDLIGVIQHLGSSIEGGHYTSLCKHSTGEWFEFNDERVKEISEKDIVNNNAYILIYMRQKLSAVSMTPSLLCSSSTAVVPIYDAIKDKNLVVEKEADRKTVKRKELEADKHYIKRAHQLIDLAKESDTEDDEPGITDTLTVLEDLFDPLINGQLLFLTAQELNIQRLEERRTPLTDVQQQQVYDALCPPYSEDILVSKFGIPITRRLAECLNPGLWLNDEVINFQMQLLQDYDKRLCANIPSRTPSHFFNLFFMSTLFRGGVYNSKNVRR